MRSLISGTLLFPSTMEDVGAAQVNYSLLDRENQRSRIRLNSTVVQVEHDGDLRMLAP